MDPLDLWPPYRARKERRTRTAQALWDFTQNAYWGEDLRGDAAIDAVARRVVRVRTARGAGNGILISEDGLLLTVKHCLGNGLHIEHQGEEYDAWPLVRTGAQRDEDLALCKAEIDGDACAARMRLALRRENGPVMLVTTHGRKYGMTRDGYVGDMWVQGGRCVQLHTQHARSVQLAGEPGDSGSPLLDKEGGLLGLLMGGDPDRGMMHYAPIERALLLAESYRQHLLGKKGWA